MPDSDLPRKVVRSLTSLGHRIEKKNKDALVGTNKGAGMEPYSRVGADTLVPVSSGATGDLYAPSTNSCGWKGVGHTELAVGCWRVLSSGDQWTARERCG